MSLINAIAAEQLCNGNGDPDAPLAPGERVSLVRFCPIDGCDWILPVEWRRVGYPTPTRVRSLTDRDRLCLEHVAGHGAAAETGAQS